MKFWGLVAIVQGFDISDFKTWNDNGTIYSGFIPKTEEFMNMTQAYDFCKKNDMNLLTIKEGLFLQDESSLLLTPTFFYLITLFTSITPILNEKF